MKTISVIIPVYNSREYIEQCISSIQNQTYRNLEIIVIDDGSSDGTEKWLEEILKTDDRIQVFHQKNSGVSSARNRGLKLAHGDYISFIDADDYINLSMYEKMVDAIEVTNADMAICTRTRVYPDGMIEDLNIEGYIESKSDDFTFTLMHSEYDWCSSCNKLYRKEMFANLFFPEDIKYGEDLYLLVDIWRKAEKVIYINEGLYYYRYNPISTSFTLGQEKLEDRIVAMEYAFQYAIENSKNNISFVFDLLFGAYAAAYFEGKNSRIFLKKYRQWFRSYFRYTFVHIKGWLFYATPNIYKFLKNRRNSK